MGASEDRDIRCGVTHRIRMVDFATPGMDSEYFKSKQYHASFRSAVNKEPSSPWQLSLHNMEFQIQYFQRQLI